MTDKAGDHSTDQLNRIVSKHIGAGFISEFSKTVSRNSDIKTLELPPNDDEDDCSPITQHFNYESHVLLEHKYTYNEEHNEIVLEHVLLVEVLTCIVNLGTPCREQ